MRLQPPSPPSPCSPVTDPQCAQHMQEDGEEGRGDPFSIPLPDLAGEFGGNMLEEAAKAFQAAVGWFVSNTASWWVKAPSPELVKDPIVGQMQQLVQPLTVAVAVMALLVVGGKMALARKA
ncbi:hypothetical protein ACFQ07_05475, partial [Actinomadura adrarensis]